MKLGDSGPKVKYVQELLNSHGFDCDIDSNFGPQTQKRVIEFQKSKGLVPDGNIGVLTMEKLEGPKNDDTQTSKFKFGQSYSASDFDKYVKGISWGSWKPSLIVIHHCAEPSLAQRPHGFEYQHMVNIKDFYKSKGWSSGPHLFIDEDEIWTFSPLTSKGIHAVSFNSKGIGIEMLGNYDTESPTSGRGWQVIQTTVKAVKSLMDRLGLDESCIRFHREDIKTSKSCPGEKITKEWFLSLFV